jgi:outer membrane protein assembly complex protein YaeT
MTRRCKTARRWNILWAGWLLAAGLVLGAGSVAPEAKQGPAKLSVAGLGWLRDRELRLSLERLLGAERGAELRANAVEDAIFLLMSAVVSDGFAKPTINVTIIDQNGAKSELTVDPEVNVTVPRTLDAREVRFLVKPGRQSYMAQVTFAGLHQVKEEAARSFFMGDSATFSNKTSRAYTPARLARALDALQAELRGLGYAEAETSAAPVTIDERTGAVSVVVTVKEGAPWRVTAVRLRGAETTGIGDEAGKSFLGQAWTDTLQQNLAGEVRKALFAKGYADAHVRLTRKAAPATEGRKDVTIFVDVQAEEIVKVGPVKFVGAEKVRDDVLQRRVEGQVGGPLDPLAIDQSRFRLARLGVFQSVELAYEPATGPVRSPIFTLHEGRTLETNLLFGYGSYEEVRGGVELRQYDLFGRAHQSRLLLVESMKSTRGDYSYTVPEIFGESVDGTVKLFGLQRNELVFQRQEYGATASLSLPVRWLGANATAGYTFQSLNNRDNNLATSAVDEKQVTVASLDVGLTRDRRDNPLRPRKGYRWFGRVEAASRVLGGEAEYQRFEVGGSYHTGWGTGRWLHLAVSHGIITTWGANDKLLPVNKRFFPGGESNLRGYREGEASPRDSHGLFIGAKSYALANVDLEQALFSKWTAVVFTDALATAAELRNYPLGGEHLYSAGLGLHYQTLIGPIRVEYGRNLNPRTGDPRGTWQVSLGAPF